MEHSQIKELVGRVTNFVLHNTEERDVWEKSIALTAILTWNDPAAVQEAEHIIARSVATQNSDGNLNYADTVDGLPGHVKTFTPIASLTSSLARPLLEYYKRTGNAAYLEAADLQMEALMNSPRTSGGGCPRQKATWTSIASRAVGRAASTWTSWCPARVRFRSSTSSIASPVVSRPTGARA